ncbi:hypothetical protein [Clostridium thermarum]|uniref:hypothetical protein n=1 Tax=Clostridium thermarum TaxID=1716543 RepID=UPI00111FCAB6|nr:hypothetical protein [Clostridium thermarum]
MDIDKDKLAAKELASKLTKKQKAEYIWQYYKLHIIVALFVIICIISLVVGKINEKDNLLNVTVYGAGINIDNFEKLSEKAYEELIDDKHKTDMLMSFENSSGATSYMSNQKITVQMAAGELDVLILSKSEFELLASNGAFIDINELSGLFSETSEKLNYVLYKVPEADTTEKAYGIDLSNFAIFDELQYSEKDPVLTVLSNSERKEMAAKFIEWLYNQKSL